MIETLNDIGYTVDFEVLNSKYFGVPQNRERIFIVAIRDDLIEQEEWSEETTKGQTVVPRGKRRLMKYEWLKSFNYDWPAQEEVTTRLCDILETDVDEKYYLDEEKTARLAARLEDIERVSDDINQVDNIDQYKRKRNNPQTGRIYGYGGMSPALSTMQGGGLEPKVAERQITPVQYNRKDGIGKELDQANTISASDWRGLNRNQNQNAVLEEIRPVLTPDRMEKRQNGRRFKDDGEESLHLRRKINTV